MKTLTVLLGLAIAAAAPIAASAAEPATRTCFSTREWKGWSAPEPDMLYLRVGTKDIYRVGLREGSPRIDKMGTFIVSEVRGSSQICTPLDLDLTLQDHTGFRGALIATSLTKLTSAEAAAIPLKDRP
jgi:hypothetical protein